MSSNFNWTLNQIAAAVQAKSVGAAATVNGVSTDTRSIKQGDLFIALRGPNFDAHDFAANAVAQGATAVMVERQLKIPVPQLIVTDTRLALGKLASAWRMQFKIPVIALTGSNGKTTVKEMTAAICAQRGAVLATQGNLNNDIGVPLTLLQINHDHHFAVIELGANHHGEIAYLTELTKPDVALINNAGPAHLEGFGSLEGVANAKGEIYAGLSTTGIAVINADDQFAPVWHQLCAGRKTITFGIKNSAQINAKWQIDEFGSQLQLGTPLGEATIRLHLLGYHNVMNAMAAAAATTAIGFTPTEIKAGLEQVKPVKGRLQLKVGKQGSRIIDDTYNANPASFKAALDVLSVFPGQRFVALGDMGELGNTGVSLHQEVGNYAKLAGVQRLYTVGPLARHAADSFGDVAHAFAEQPQLISALQSDLSSEVTLLVKGSRSTHMEHVVNALTQTEG